MRMRVWTLIPLLLWAAFVEAGPPATRPASIRVAGSSSGYKSQEITGHAFTKATGIPVGVESRDNSQGLAQLAQGRMDVLVYSLLPGVDEAKEVAKAFSTGPLPTRAPFGQFAVFVVVHKENPMPGLSLGQLKSLYAGKVNDWRDVGGRPGPVKLYGEGELTKSWEIMKTRVMGDLAISPALQVRKSANEIASEVKQDSGAIGFFLYRQQEIKDVKIVGLRETALPTASYLAPTDTNVFEAKYPLAEELVLYLPAKAALASRQYVDFATGPEAITPAQAWFVYPNELRQQHLAQKRLTEWRAGQGPTITATGTRLGRHLLEGADEDFIKAQTVAQMRFTEANDANANAAFVNGAELLLTDGPVNEKALQNYKAKWDALVELVPRQPMAATTSQPATRPLTPRILETITPPRMPEYKIGGRAVALIVPLANKLDALTVDQVRLIFAGQMRDWKILAALDIPGTTEVHCYCPDRPEAAFDTFFSIMNLKDVGGLGTTVRKKTNAEVLSTGE